MRWERRSAETHLWKAPSLECLFYHRETFPSVCLGDIKMTGQRKCLVAQRAQLEMKWTLKIPHICSISVFGTHLKQNRQQKIACYQVQKCTVRRVQFRHRRFVETTNSERSSTCYQLVLSYERTRGTMHKKTRSIRIKEFYPVSYPHWVVGGLQT